jgi:hypothetical protein
MHKYVELAELISDSTHDTLVSIADKRIAEAVEEFKTRFPKRKLHMGPINGDVAVIIDDRMFNWDENPVSLGAPKGPGFHVEAPFFEFLTEAIRDVEQMFGHWGAADFTEIKITPKETS